MCCINYEKDNNHISDYDVQIDSECYNNDYDNVDVPQEEETTKDSNILFE